MKTESRGCVMAPGVKYLTEADCRALTIALFGLGLDATTVKQMVAVIARTPVVRPSDLRWLAKRRTKAAKS